MRRRAFIALPLLGALVSSSGCEIVVGGEPATSTSSSSSSGAGGTGGSGGTGSTTSTTSTSTSSTTSSSGGACITGSDCPGVEDDCRKRTCDNGECGMTFTADGTPVTAQTAGDCVQIQCDGAGNTKTVIDDGDVPDDANPCTDDICSAGVASHPPTSLGAVCGADAICDGKGACVGCVAHSDCPGADTECRQRTCEAGACGLSFTAASTPVAAQTDHDCSKAVCDGAGNVTNIADDTDLPLDDGNGCTDEACNAGVPAHPAKADGTSCSDGDACTAGDFCVAGACKSGNPVVCAALDACHDAGTCDPATGVCSNPPKPDGSTCSGGTCQSGVCGGCPAVAGGSTVWTTTISGAGALSYSLGPIAAAPTDDVYVSDAYIQSVQSSRIHHLGPNGAYLGAVTGASGGSGIFPPTFLGTDPLGNLLYSYYTSMTGGWVSSYAYKRPPSGTGTQSVGSMYSSFSSYDQLFGHEAGDAAGHWLIATDIHCFPPCGYGGETGKHVLRYDAAGTYLGSIPDPGNWQLAPSGDLYVVTGFQGTIDAGCGPVTGAAGQNTLLSKLNFDGACVWSKAFAAPEPVAFAIGGDGSILLGFNYTGTIDLGSGPLPDFGANNLTIAKLDLSGKLLMTSTSNVGSSTGQVQLDAAPFGIVLLAGYGRLAAFNPDGQLRWSSSFGNARVTRQACNVVIATQASTTITVTALAL